MIWIFISDLQKLRGTDDVSDEFAEMKVTKTIKIYY